ncbi:MAG: NUDIX domain-containing protein [Spirochaetaceae bacterium]|nr:NUDIX domain-containing protein [Spirochaetaceae bacterium]
MKELKYCPNCGKETLSYVNNRKWSCSECHLSIYNNVAAAVGLVTIIEKDGVNNILLIKRGREPKKDYLAVPGGFVDPGESAEEAAGRECYEEIGLVPDRITYLTSATNNYKYNEIDYITCDIFFKATFKGSDSKNFLLKLKAEDSDEILGFELYPLTKKEDINSIPLAFKSAEVALSSLFK